MSKLRQSNRVTLPSGRTFLYRYARKNKTYLPTRATIKRRYKRWRQLRDERGGSGFGSPDRKTFGVPFGFRKLC